MDYKNQLYNKEWEYIEPNINNCLEIRLFDDGNEKYKIYPNEWILFGTWKGKIALFNKTDSNIIIKSISSWKVII